MPLHAPSLSCSDWPCLSPEELAVLSALSRSDRLKQQVLKSSPPVPVGHYLPLGHSVYQIQALAGSGMTSWVYRVVAHTGGKPLALKQLRFPLAYLKQCLALEAAVATTLASASELAVAEIIARSDTALLKRWVGGQTLQALLCTAQVLPAQQTALEAALQLAADFFHRYGLLLDLSPKNLAWDGQRWCLLDAGPKIHRSDYEALLQDPTWERWLAFFSERIHSPVSRPSVLERNGNEVLSAERSDAFLNHLYMWLPVDPEPPAQYFFARIQASARQGDILLRRQGHDVVWASNLDPPWLADNPWLTWLARQRLASTDTPLSPPVFWSSSESPLHTAELLNFLEKPQGYFQAPRLQVRPYRHWSDLEDPQQGYQPTDIYCQEPLPMERHHLPPLHAITYTLSPDPGTLILELVIVPSQKSASDQVLVLLPGFRAAPEAAFPLIACLEEKSPVGAYVVVRMGLRNQWGQALLGGGVVETCLLWYLLDYLQQAWKCQRLILMAASYATIPAILLAGIHPLIQGLILDSPICRPMELLFWLGQRANISPSQLCFQLSQVGLPARPFALALHLPAGFAYRIFHPHTDRFTQICGRLEGAEPTCFYPGPHAASLRHDTVYKGIPTPLLEGLTHFLRQQRDSL